MNTPAHVIFGAAAFARPGRPAVTGAALAGGLLPDLSLYVLSAWALFVEGMSPGIVFGRLYHSDTWQAVFAVDNSFVLWGAVLAVSLALRSPAGTAFAGAGLLHLALDFPLHHDDARRMFWPVSDRVFVSPVSYWDPAHYGSIVAPLEMLASAGLCGVLLYRFRGRPARLGIVALGLAELLPGMLFGGIL